MRAIFVAILRVMALVIIFTVLLAIASSLTGPAEITQRLTPEQVRQATAALPLVSLIMTLMLAYLALRSRWHGWQLAGALSVIFYGLYALLGWFELLAFPAVSRQMPAGMTRGLLIGGLVLAIPFSPLAVWILGKTRKDPAEDSVNDRRRMSASEWTFKVAASAILYVIVYFTFGYYVAWRTPGLPEFYGGTDPGTFLGQLGNVMRDTPWLPALQIFRGLLWTGIGIIIIRMHKGEPWETILATGLTFTVLMNASLLFPNPFMPPVVAHAHAIELVSSNFLYGILASGLILWNPTQQERSARQAHCAN